MFQNLKRKMSSDAGAINTTEIIVILVIVVVTAVFVFNMISQTVADKGKAINSTVAKAGTTNPK